MKTSDPVQRYLERQRASADDYVLARAALVANDDAVDVRLARAFWEKALAQLPAAHSDLEGLGPRALQAFIAAARDVDSIWCALLGALDVDEVLACWPLIRTAHHASMVPDGGGDAGRAAIAALAGRPAVVKALQRALLRHHFVPAGFVAVVLAEGSATSVACVDKVLKRDEDDSLPDLLVQAVSAVTPAAKVLLQRCGGRLAARDDEGEHPAVRAALGIDAYPERFQISAHWPSTSGHALHLIVERHGPTDPPSWWLTFGKSKPVLSARSDGQYPNRFGVPLFSWATLPAWLAAVAARFNTRFVDPVEVRAHGLPAPSADTLRRTLEGAAPAPSSSTSKATAEETAKKAKKATTERTAKKAKKATTERTAKKAPRRT